MAFEADGQLVIFCRLILSLSIRMVFPRRKYMQLARRRAAMAEQKFQRACHCGRDIAFLAEGVLPSSTYRPSIALASKPS